MDIRIDTKFFQHPKTLKLLHRLGPEGVIGLLKVWLWAGENRQDGRLHGLSSEDVDLIAGWDPVRSDPVRSGQSFCSVAMELHWIDEEDGTLVLHEWQIHNPWVADAPSRSDKARFTRLASVAPAAYLKLAQQGQTSITAEEYRAVVGASTTRQRNVNVTPTPDPIPTPVPVIKDGPDKTIVDSVDKLIQLYRRFPGYKPEDATKERVWIESLIPRFVGLNVAEEVEKAYEWVKLQDFTIKNSRAYLVRWLERVQKERS